MGSNRVQPPPSDQTSTHECASPWRTTYEREKRLNVPPTKPVTLRAGTPSVRSITVIAVE